MGLSKRATIYFAPEIHKALRLRAAANDCTVSDMVNDAVKAALAEDAIDLAAIDARKNEKTESFESFVQNLKRRGKI